MDGFKLENNITCKKCDKKVPIETMQIDKYGEMMVCEECAGKQYKRKSRRKVTPDGGVIEMRPERGSLAYSNPEIGRAQRLEKADQTIAYKCTYCSYEFERRKAFPFKGQCPYCNKNKVALDPIKTGQWIEKLW